MHFARILPSKVSAGVVLLGASPYAASQGGPHIVHRNPWVTTPSVPIEQVDRREGGVLDAPGERSHRGASRPQPGVPRVDVTDRLRTREVTDDGAGALWVVGVHGGSGESTLAAWLGAPAAGHAWPVHAAATVRVLLVARTHARGLAAARKAATEWASGSPRVELMGLVLMGDAPGRLPSQLRDEAHQLTGGVPQTWTIPFLPALRTSATPDPDPPGPAARPLRSITRAFAQRHDHRTTT